VSERVGCVAAEDGRGRQPDYRSRSVAHDGDGTVGREAADQ